MKILQILTLIAFGSLLVACNGKTAEQEQAQQELWDEMMVVHDEVMPKMGEISSLRRQLKAKMEAMDSTETEMIASVDATMAQLDAADIGMMDWMGALTQLPELRENKNHEQIMAYLEEEKAKVDKVKTDMLNALEAGRSKLKELEDMETPDESQ